MSKLFCKFWEGEGGCEKNSLEKVSSLQNFQKAGNIRKIWINFPPLGAYFFFRNFWDDQTDRYLLENCNFLFEFGPVCSFNKMINSYLRSMARLFWKWLAQKISLFLETFSLPRKIVHKSWIFEKFTKSLLSTRTRSSNFFMDEYFARWINSTFCRGHVNVFVLVHSQLVYQLKPR